MLAFFCDSPCRGGVNNTLLSPSSSAPPITSSPAFECEQRQKAVYDSDCSLPLISFFLFCYLKGDKRDKVIADEGDEAKIGNSGIKTGKAKGSAVRQLLRQSEKLFILC